MICEHKCQILELLHLRQDLVSDPEDPILFWLKTMISDLEVLNYVQQKLEIVP